MKKTLAALLALAGPGVPYYGSRRGAYHPNSANGWHGLRPRRETGSLIHSGGTLRHEPAPKFEVNTTPQPWQKHAAKLAARRVAHLGWNERHLAREERNRLLVAFGSEAR